ncbi:MAG: polysaccharide deacetylase family protein [Candidatus Aenigmarchaeota archaeon]|nr:polysaccharide deacetylase family protein [Candidatus Aenigmarchaeota archaeon]
MFKDYYRLINEFRCRLISRSQKIFFSNEDIGYITIFHDYEGEYAGDSLADVSYRGVNKILDIEAKHKIRATYNIVGKLINDVPGVIARIVSGGHEIASHSYDHRIMTTLSKSEIISDIERTKKILDSIKIELKGFRSPQNKWNFKQMDVLLDQGINWSAEADKIRFPYILKQRSGRFLVRMPVAMDDWVYQSKKIEPEVMFEMLLSTANKIACKKEYGAIGFHPWVQGLDERRLDIFERFINEISQRQDIKIIPFEEMNSILLDRLKTRNHKKT